jgi:hypothetical protein
MCEMCLLCVPVLSCAARLLELALLQTRQLPEMLWRAQPACRSGLGLVGHERVLCDSCAFSTRDLFFVEQHPASTRLSPYVDGVCCACAAQHELLHDVAPAVLDDNRMLCLPNGERIRLDEGRLRLLFEVEGLQYASPATVSR